MDIVTKAFRFYLFYLDSIGYNFKRDVTLKITFLETTYNKHLN